MAKGYTITGLDIGTSQIKTLVALKKPEQSKLEILAQVSALSSGIRKGVVFNQEEVVRGIKKAIGEAERISHQKIKKAYCSLGGSHIFVVSSQGVVAVSRADQTISQEDIDRAMLAAQAYSLPQNKEILNILPKEFIIDGEGGIKNALGMKGIRLEVQTLILGGFTPYIKNLTEAILGADIEIEDLVLSPLASARAILTPRQKELGVVLVDIGAGTTGLAVFEEGDLIHLAVIPLGSANITNDIAIGLKTDIDIAERIKLEFGIALPQSTEKKEMIDLSESLGEPLTFSRKELAEIIEARLSEIFDLINKELKNISRAQLLPAGVVLTGGGANLPKIKELAKKELRLPARIGYPQEFTSQIEDPSFSVCAGLALWGQDLETEKPPSFFKKGPLSKIKRIFKAFIP
jgi:cell division protein FtsA